MDPNTRTRKSMDPLSTNCELLSCLSRISRTELVTVHPRFVAPHICIAASARHSRFTLNDSLINQSLSPLYSRDIAKGLVLRRLRIQVR
jgi:hypothetical protein